MPRSRKAGFELSHLTLAQTRYVAHIATDVLRGDWKQLIHNLVPFPNLGKDRGQSEKRIWGSGSGDPCQ